MSRMVLNPSRGTWSPAPPSAATRSAALDSEIPRDRVDPQLVEVTERTARLAARSLGLDPCPSVRWLPPGTGVRGVVFSENLREVWVTAQSQEATKNTALHELRHVWQLEQDRWLHLDLLTMDARQRDADRFAASWVPFEEMKSATGRRLVHKGSPLAIEVKAGTAGSFTAYASTWTTDQVNERFVKGAFAASLQRRAHRPLLWSHDSSQVVGVEQSLAEDSTGLRGEWSFADTQQGQDVRKLVTSGAVQGMSVGFVPLRTREAEGGVTEILEADLWENSLVALPCNLAATVQSVKSVPMPAVFDLRAELATRRHRRYAR